MISTTLKSFVKKIPFIRRLFPSMLVPNSERFIQLRNDLSDRTIWMYLRKDSYMEREFLTKGLYGSWEKESLKIWAELSKRSNYILDIGANTGVYSLIAKSQNSSANVYSIEPIDVNFNILTKNINKNAFDIKAEKFALSSKEGNAKMFMLKDRLNYMTSINDNRYTKHPEITKDHPVVEVDVPIKTYRYLKDKYNIPKLELIKIDVEGHELEVLANMKEFIRKDKPTILVEVIGDQNAVELNSMFLDLGYRFISINENDKSSVVDNLWDNDHHNFLICDDEIVNILRSKHLVK